MSTDFDLYCLDCETTAEVDAGGRSPIRRADLEPIIALARVATPAILAAIGACGELSPGPHGARVPIGWLLDHCGHRLGLRTEYGEVYDDV